MKILTNTIDLGIHGSNDVIDITEAVQDNLQQTLLEDGNVTVFIPSSTAAVSTIEYEEGLITDLKGLFQRLVPDSDDYHHDEKWHDGDGRAQLSATLLRSSLTIPFKQAKLLLGPWQHIIFVDFDQKKKPRKIILQFIGL